MTFRPRRKRVSFGGVRLLIRHSASRPPPFVNSRLGIRVPGGRRIVGVLAMPFHPVCAVSGQRRRMHLAGGVSQVGGTFLGSARCAEFREESGRSKALRNLAQRGIDGVVVIGGNGSQTGSYMLSQLGVHVVGIASTIDNDLLGTDISIGCDTAINVTLGAIDHLR